MNWYFADLGTVSYKTAWDLQANILEAKKENNGFPDIVLFLEHSPVFTMGRTARPENLRLSESEAEKAGIEIIQTDRGGDVTYHGPGQVIGYPVISLEKKRLRVTKYVEKLEETMIRTARAWNINAGRNCLNHGAWVGGKKLGSIGLAIKRKIAMHGFAINADLPLDPYDWINPCGLEHISMTSLTRETGGKIEIHRVKQELRKNMEDIFQVSGRDVSENELYTFREGL